MVQVEPDVPVADRLRGGTHEHDYDRVDGCE
jgi:hypothetical protein